MLLSLPLHMAAEGHTTDIPQYEAQQSSQAYHFTLVLFLPIFLHGYAYMHAGWTVTATVAHVQQLCSYIML